jgi:hypothetical protein
LHNSVKTPNPKKIEDEFKKALQVLGVFDTASKHEYACHVFFAGVLSNLHLISNRESGFGRYNIQVEFRWQSGANLRVQEIRGWGLKLGRRSEEGFESDFRIALR